MCTGSIVLMQVVLHVGIGLIHNWFNTQVPAAEPFGKIHI